MNSALELASQGIPVFPVNADKTPACAHGFKDAVTDADAVKALWRGRKDLLVSIATGIMSGIDGLDIDGRHGGGEWYAANRHRLPKTRTHRTRSGGLHLLFRHRPGLRCSTSKIAPGVDIRADGGSLIWWPAFGFRVLSDAPAADWPEWIIAVLMPPKPAYTPAPIITPSNDKYAAAALRHAAEAVAGAPEGSRNATLNKEAWAILRFAVAGALSTGTIAATLASAALSAGLDRNEIMKTLASTIRAKGLAA